MYLVKSEQNVKGLIAFFKAMVDVRHLKRICKEGATQEKGLLELLGGPGTDFRRRVVFWSIRSLILER